MHRHQFSCDSTLPLRCSRVCGVSLPGLSRRRAMAWPRPGQRPGSRPGQRTRLRPEPPERQRGDEPRLPDDARFMDPFEAINATGDYRIDALLSGYKWSTTTVTYSFYEDSVWAGQYYGTETPSEVSEPVKTNVRAIMALYSTLMNVNFVEVTEPAAPSATSASWSRPRPAMPTPTTRRARRCSARLATSTSIPATTGSATPTAFSIPPDSMATSA